MMPRFRATLVAMAGALLLANASASAATSNAGNAFAASRFPGKANAGILYASNFYPSCVEIYAAGQPGAPLIGTIANGVSGSYNLAVDKSETLYVQNNNGTISEFPRGALTPTKILSETVRNGTGVGVTIGPDGTVYSSDHYDGVVFAFAHGSTSPTAAYSLAAPLGLAVSEKNVLYVSYHNGANGTDGIEAFPGGKGPGHDMGIRLKSAGGLAIDPAGHLLAGDQGTQVIDVFNIGSSTPIRQISTAPYYPYQFAFDNNAGDLYVASGQPNGVSVYRYATGKPVGTIIEGFSSQDYTLGVALAPAG